MTDDDRARSGGLFPLIWPHITDGAPVIQCAIAPTFHLAPALSTRVQRHVIVPLSSRCRVSERVTIDVTVHCQFSFSGSHAMKTLAATHARETQQVRLPASRLAGRVTGLTPNCKAPATHPGRAVFAPYSLLEKAGCSTGAREAVVVGARTNTGARNVGPYRTPSSHKPAIRCRKKTVTRDSDAGHATYLNQFWRPDETFA